MTSPERHEAQVVSGQAISVPLKKVNFKSGEKSEKRD